jgi:hypothetical protein
MKRRSQTVANFYTKFELSLTKDSQRQLDINILQIFIKDHPTRRDALAINDNRALGLFGNLVDSSDVWINGNLRPSG